VTELSPSARAKAFARTRAAHRDETAQDYAEAVAELVREHGVARVGELARRMGVSHVTVSKTIARLHGAGLVRAEPYRGVSLTPAGARLARQSARRHEVVLAFLLWLGVPEKQALIDAEGIEHHASNQTIAAMRRVVRAP